MNDRFALLLVLSWAVSWLLAELGRALWRLWRFERLPLAAFPLGALYGVLRHLAYSLHAASNPDVAALQEWWNGYGFQLNEERAQEDAE